ncbi:hypothetical protein ACTFIV_010859 [Dictyostelium citrinum]
MIGLLMCALDLNNDQNIAAQQLLNQLYGINTQTPCANSALTCVNGNNGYLILTQINTGVGGGGGVTITKSLSIFTDLNSITIGPNFFVSTTFWTDLIILTKLNVLSIDYVNQTIPNNIQLPPSLTDVTFKKISVPLPDLFFSSGNVQNLNIEDASYGFQYPATLSSCQQGLSFVYLIVTFYAILPNNIEICSNLGAVYLIVNNDNSDPQYTDFDFPYLASLPISDCAIYFRNSDQNKIQTWRFPESISKLPKLNYLTIEGRGFIFPENNLIDLSIYTKSTTIDFLNVGFLDSCIIFGCIKFPENVNINFKNHSLIMNNLDYSNISSVIIEGNSLGQPLPTPSTLQHIKIKSFWLTNSQFMGSIPTTNNFYCKFNANVLRIHSNQLSGNVPTCFKCYPPNGDSGMLFPNNFNDFTSSSIPPTTCPTLSFNKTISPIKTNIVSFITISGADFGWSYSTVSPTPSASVVSIDSMIPNTQIVLRIPQSDGTGKSLVARFSYYAQSITFTYSYEVPTVLSKYRYVKVGSEYLMVISGTGFSYVYQNLAIINSATSNQSIAIQSTKNSSLDQFTITSTTPFVGMAEGTTYTFSVRVGNQVSSQLILYYYREVSMTVTPLLSIGGKVTFVGVFKVANPSVVSIKIGGLTCTVNAINTTSVTFTYPVMSVGTYDLVMLFQNNYEFTTQITVSPTPAPTILNKIAWSGSNELVIFGSSFSYVTSNVVQLNSTPFSILATASTTQPGYDQINLPSSATTFISEGSLFNVSITTVGQTSATQIFYLIKPITMTTQSLYTIGGEATFTGSYSTSNKSLATLKLDGSDAPITSLSPTSISFLYPYKSAPGSFALVLNIGTIEISKTVAVSNSPIPTLMNKYYWTTLENGDSALTFCGKYFTYYYKNIISINGTDYDSTPATKSNLGSSYPDEIKLLNPTPQSLVVGSSFSVKVKVSSQSTSLLNFIFIKSVSIDVLPLQSIGGVISFGGSYGTSDKSSVTFSINGIACYVISISPTAIQFQYPTYSAGTYQLIYFVGGFEYKTNVTYISSPPPQVLYKYEWTNDHRLIVNGKWFGYYGSNTIVLNDVEYVVASAVASPTIPGYDRISLSSATPTSPLSIGQAFTIKVMVQGQSSNVVTFNFINSIVVNVKDLNTTGGIVSFTGMYGVSNKALVTLSINGTSCPLNSVSFSSITFRYPPFSGSPGQYPLLINVSGFEYTTNVQYVVPTSPVIFNKYKWSSDKTELVIYGTSFSYDNLNSIIINGVNYTSTFAYGAEGSDAISFSLEDFSIVEGQLFTIQIESGGLLSNIVSFNYIKEIYLSNEENLYTFGSSGTLLDGKFGTSNNTIISLSINGFECKVIEITPTTIKFSYPPLSIGSQEILINIGGLDYSTRLNVVKPPAPTLLKSYYWSSSDIIVFKGSWFDYVTPNTVEINGDEFISSVASSNNGNDEITFGDDSSTSDLSIGDNFTVRVESSDQFSNSITFIYLKSILITTNELNSKGGNATFNGEYHVSDKSLATLTIDGSYCNVFELTGNSMTFGYPAKSDGIFDMFLNIGGFELSTTVTYKTPSTTAVQTITTGSQITTTGSQTTGSQTTTDSPTSQTSTTGIQSTTTGSQSTTNGQTTTDSPTSQTSTTGSQSTTTGSQSTTVGSQSTTTGSQSTTNGQSTATNQPSTTDDVNLSLSSKLLTPFILLKIIIIILLVLF